jgi:curved DNA-binding protein CbpA
MKTLYDVIGARPDDDAESLKKAYRQAAKANHPDHHGGDLEAARRFRRITASYDILRDAERRAAYDRLLEIRRKPLRTKLKLAIVQMRRHVVYDTAVAAAITVVLIGGYAAVSRFSAGTSAEAETGVTGREGVQTTAVAAAGDSGTGRSRVAAQMPIVVLATAGADTTVANDRAPEEAKGESTPDAAGPAVTVARRDDDADGLTSRPAATGVAGDSSNSLRPAPPERSKAPTVEVSFFSAEKAGGRRGSWPHVAASGERRDVRTSDARVSDIRNSDTKNSDTKTTESSSANAGPHTSIRRQVAARPAVEQAALENRNTPAGDVPPLFGVGF